MLGARVEFHLKENGMPITFDVGHVFVHTPNPDQTVGGTFLVTSSGYNFHVREPYHEVSAAIKKATERH
jgi:hypothetical protein